MSIKNFADAKMELNSACDTLEDIFGDYEEIADAMARINAVIDFLWRKEQQEGKKYAEKKARARQKAIDWQREQAELGLSYSEVIAQAEKFRKLGKKYGLIREFRENGII